MKLRIALPLFLLIILCVSFSAVVQAQQPASSLNYISGTVYDQLNNPISQAKVYLYNADVDHKPTNLVDTFNNPQLSGSSGSPDAGRYVFDKIPSGWYVLTAEKGGTSVSKVFMVSGGMTYDIDIKVNGYVDNGATPTPEPTSVPVSPTADPTHDTSNTQGGIDFLGLLKVLLGGIIVIQLIAGLVILALWGSRK